MKSLFLALFVTCLAATAALAQFPNFPAADLVLGASDFTTTGSGAPTASTMNLPGGLAVDPVSGKLFVADSMNNRILRFANTASLTNGANAEAVFGQPDFITGAASPPTSGIKEPYELHVDGSGRLWVSDYGNNRVLMYAGASSLPTFGGSPTLVLGQPDFDTTTPGTSTTKMNGPDDVYVDAAGNLWVSDYNNNRVLKFANASSLASGAAATAVLGQPDFNTGTAGTNASKMDRPEGLVVDTAGRLWVADSFNNRMLRFDNAASLGNGAAANGVLGQVDFDSALPFTSADSMREPVTPVIDAAGTLYVSDSKNERILLFKNAAAKVNGAPADGVIGQPDFTSDSNDTTERKLNNPYGLALDTAGNLWVADYSNSRVLRFPSDRAAAAPAVKGKVPKSTAKGKLTLKGTATDPNGVAQVRYRVGKGTFQAASGTTSWTLKAKLKPGKNSIEIVVVDTLGNVSPAKIVKVKRQ